MQRSASLFRDRSRDLRRNMTDAERRLWSALRLRRIGDHKFRRQQPMGNYIVDFICAEARLIVEVDGRQYADEEQAWYDKHRTDWLRSKGYRIMRFWNEDVLKRPNHVIDAIRHALGEAPHPTRGTRATFPLKGGRAKPTL